MIKKTYVIILILLLQSSYVFSQNQWWFGFGYNMSRFKMDDGLNYVIDRYNQTRTTSLTKEMKPVHFADGLAFSLGFNFYRFIFDIGYTGKKETVFAQGNFTSGSNLQRDIRFKNKCMNMGMGYAFLNTRNASVALCATVDVGTVRTETRTGEISGIGNESYEEITNDLSMGSTFYMQFLLGFGRGKGIALIARPYYQLSYFDTDFYDVNAEINPTTYMHDPDDLACKTSNVGLALILAIYGSSR